MIKRLPETRYFQSEEAKEFYGKTVVGSDSTKNEETIVSEVQGILSLLECPDPVPESSDHPPILIPRSMIELDENYRVIEGVEYTAIPFNHVLYSRISLMIGEHKGDIPGVLVIKAQDIDPNDVLPLIECENSKISEPTVEDNTIQDHVEQVDLSGDLTEMLLLKSNLDKRIKAARSEGNADLVNELRKQRRRVRKRINELS